MVKDHVIKTLGNSEEPITYKHLHMTYLLLHNVEFVGFVIYYISKNEQEDKVTVISGSSLTILTRRLSNIQVTS